jgi:hypothetical protein
MFTAQLHIVSFYDIIYQISILAMVGDHHSFEG